jgi:ABC-type Na+ efflux pump permease subunit
MYLACFFGVGVSVAVFAVNPLIREKYRGSIESLLATPLKPKSIWLGKSLAAFLPGLVMGEAFAAIALVAINYIYILPQSGFQISLPLAISSFLLAPIMVFGFSLLVTLVGLTGSPTTANAIVIAYMVIIGVATGVIGPNNIPGTSSWLFTLVNLGIAAMIGIVIAFLYPRLTKEGIVLSRRR